MKNSIALNLFGFNKINKLSKNLRQVSNAFFGKILAHFMQPKTKINSNPNVDFNFKVRPLGEVINGELMKQKNNKNADHVNDQPAKISEMKFVTDNGKLDLQMVGK